MDEQSLLQSNTITTTTVEGTSNPTPMDSHADSTTNTVISPDVNDVETEIKSVVVNATSSSDTTNNDVVGLEDQARCCIGRNNEGMSWGTCMEQGRRSTMEDCAVVKYGFMEVRCNDVGGCTAPECEYAAEKSPVHYFGVFDGHGGDQVSNYCANELSAIVAEEWERGNTIDGWNKRWEVALCKAYDRADVAFKDNTALASKSAGSTALTLIISPCQIIAANCGDSRALLCRGDQAIPLTVDHKPDRADELERITSIGGRVLNWGCSRVEGILAMSRAIGDHDLKPWVIAVPEVTFTTRTDEDECLILASDGLWDVLSNEDVVTLAREELIHRRRLVEVNESPFRPAWYVCRKLLKQALLARSADNISIIVVDLKMMNV